MLLMPFDEIEPNVLSFSNIRAFKYSPKIYNFSINMRKKSTFLFVKKGTYVYSFGTKNIEAKNGDIVYIPGGSSYNYKITSVETFSYQIEFDVYNTIANQPVVFSETPTKLSSPESASIFEMINKYQMYSATSKKILVFSEIYKLIAEFSKFFSNTNITIQEKRTYEAMHYIEKNYNKKVYVKKIAEICNTSVSQIRKDFNAVLGISPIEYKRKITIKAACDLLSNSELNISEISVAMGFDNVYYFSKTFKDIKGISPKQFREIIINI